MTDGDLRSNFERGSVAESTRRAQWKGMGMTDEDLEKPKIAVVNSSSDLAVCFDHLDDVAEEVKKGVREAGGLPLEIRTTAPSDFIVSAGDSGYILASRDLVVNDMEVPVEGAQLDGMVCLSSCDKTPPAHLMAAGRFDVPTVVVPCGYQGTGECNGTHVDIEDVFVGSVEFSFGELDESQLLRMSDNAITGPGVCAGIATANSMHTVCEALGMSLPGGAPIRADSPDLSRYARRAGSRIVDMVYEDLRPSDVMTEGAFRNAVAAVLAVSGSINCIKHLQATATEAGVDVDVFELFEEVGRETPVLSRVRPNGPDRITDFDDAGGARGLLKQLSPILDLDALTVTGETMGEVLADAAVDEEVIRPLDRPFADEPSIVILEGSLAPESAVCKLGLRDPDRQTSFTGEAVVYDDGQSAIEGIQRGEVEPGQVLTVRGMGPKGGPAMSGGASGVVFALYSAGLENEVAFVSDGQLSGLCNKGLTVAEVSPEGAVGGPLGLVEDGDEITVDVDERRLDLHVDPETLAARREAAPGEDLPEASGWLGIYQRTVQPMSTGAVLIDTEEGDGGDVDGAGGNVDGAGDDAAGGAEPGIVDEPTDADD